MNELATTILKTTSHKVSKDPVAIHKSTLKPETGLLVAL
jgi:hypothetical protein